MEGEKIKKEVKVVALETRIREFHSRPEHRFIVPGIVPSNQRPMLQYKVTIKERQQLVLSRTPGDLEGHVNIRRALSRESIGRGFSKGDPYTLPIKKERHRK